MNRDVFRFGRFELDPDSFQLRESGHALRLERIPMELLILLTRNAGLLVSREEIFENLWGRGTSLDADNAINTAIRKIRRALRERPGRPRFIETVPRKGYRFRNLGQAETVGDTASKSGTGKRAMLAVLPLENLSNDPGQEYFSDGLTDDIITHLGALNPYQLGVIARTSVMQFKNTRKSIREIGSRLEVDHVLEGTVRRLGERVHVTAQLIRVSDETHVWAQSYERELVDILRLQDEIANEIAGQIRVRFVAPKRREETRVRAVHRDAYDAYLKGLHFWNRKSEKCLVESLTCYGQAIELDPAYTLAYTGLADSYILLGIHGYCPAAEVYPEAESLAKRALELDQELAEGHAALAEVQKDYYRDWPAAEAGYRRALDLNPNYGVAHGWYADFLSKMGRHAEAIQSIERAREIDPLSLAINAFVAFTYYRARRHDEAVREGLQAVELAPDIPLGHWFLGLAYEGAGSPRKAVAELSRAVELSAGAPLFLAALGHACALAGDEARVRIVLDEMLLSSDRRYISPLDMAIIYAGIGDADSAFLWLEKAYEERVTRIQELFQPTFDRLRGDARYEAMMRRLNLPIP